jgi:murein DD-endopeptidase MepM/ murein hydrolase activator NlpD
MSSFAVIAGQTVTRGEVIGYVGHSGRVSGATGNHVHYEVRIRNTPVNPHKYLRMTLAQLGDTEGTSSAVAAAPAGGPAKAASAGMDR